MPSNENVVMGISGNISKSKLNGKTVMLFGPVEIARLSHVYFLCLTKSPLILGIFSLSFSVYQLA